MWCDDGPVCVLVAAVFWWLVGVVLLFFISFGGRGGRNIAIVERIKKTVFTKGVKYNVHLKKLNYLKFTRISHRSLALTLSSRAEDEETSYCE